MRRVIFIFMLTLPIMGLLLLRPSNSASTDLGGSQGQVDHVNWVAESLREMDKIKVGMTRRQLLEVFTVEGGLSSRIQRRYVSRRCPYFKVDVEFKAVGTADGPLLQEGSQDKIVKISQPFIEWSISD